MSTAAGPHSPAHHRRLTRPADVRAALASPALIVPPVPPVDRPAATAAWLRATVARFSSGVEHDRRRAATVAELARVDPEQLRRRSEDRAAAMLAGGGRLADLVGPIARTVPVTVLDEALGPYAESGAGPGTSGSGPGESAVTRAVADIARVYQPRPDVTVAEEARADRAVAGLVGRFGGVPDEATAMRVGLLVQTHDATAALVERATDRLLAPDRRLAPAGSDAIAAAVDAVLRTDPPARSTRRMTFTGAVVQLDLAGSDLAFGAGSHACPGRGPALALATGILGALVAATRPGGASGGQDAWLLST